MCSLWQKLRSCNLPHPNRGLKPRSLFRMTTQLAYILWPSVESAIHIVFRGLNHSNLHTKTANVRAVVVDGGGGGGWWWWWLFPGMRGFWGKVTIRSPPALFFFFKVETSSRIRIPLFIPGSVHSGSASWDDCGRVFPDELRVSSFHDRFPYYGWTTMWSALSDFFGLRVYACLGIACHCTFSRMTRVFYVPLQYTGIEQTGHKSPHRKLTLEKKILPPLLPGFELATFRSRVRRSTQQAILACI